MPVSAAMVGSAGNVYPQPINALVTGLSGAGKSTIANLLDNLSPKTRDLAERRLDQLREQRRALELRQGEIDRLAGEESQVQDSAHQVARFLGGLEFALRHGVPEEKLTALRRCIESVIVDKASGTADLKLRPLPAPFPRTRRPIAGRRNFPRRYLNT